MGLFKTKEVAEFCSLPILDLFANSGIYPLTPAHKEKYTADGLHPIDLGHRVLARRLIKFIDENIY